MLNGGANEQPAHAPSLPFELMALSSSNKRATHQDTIVHEPGSPGLDPLKAQRQRVCEICHWRQ